ncbi:YdcF family protein [Dinoroseobacter sp. PD6]|uniref:YdcF family protein n=1 Tax=Dinoroseobacter sp. PD6 TaxID=3028384 RepID=UPI00237C28F5|nr:YdcF family protein [Dinoroseobacter sp. PD6]MDD9715578.1 YdcF family protein [Dinoroseobacter sp. PD6]
MGVMRALWQLCKIGVLVLMGFAVATFAGIVLYEPPARSEYAAIVVLSHGVAADGTLSPQTAARTQAGLDAFEAGYAPKVIFSGGLGGLEPASKGALMAEAAIAAGLPAEVAMVEGESHSTLQNALFTARLVPELRDQPVLLVTHRYHGMRSIASFWWAGFRDLDLVAADPDRIEWQGAAAEPIKWAGNMVRGAVYSVAAALGLGGPRLDALLT